VSLGSKNPEPKFWGKQAKKSNRKVSQEQEKYLETKLRARTTPNSGATPFASQKGDLQGAYFLWEAKRTEGGRLVLGRKILTKVCREASKVDKCPGLVVTIDDLPSHIDNEWVIVPLDMFQEMLEFFLTRE
jgi:hypothetical protein